MSRPLDILSPDQAAERLQIDVSEVVALIEAGRLGACRVGGTWRLTERDLHQLLRRGGSAGVGRARPYVRPAGWAGAVGAALLLTGIAALAQDQIAPDNVPRTIPYVGVLEQDGSSVDNRQVELEVALDDGGDNTWQDDALQVTPVDGRFELEIGASPDNPIPAWAFEAEVLQLSMVVDGEALEGRQRILATPFAVRASEASLLVSPPDELTVGPLGQFSSLPDALAALNGRLIPAGQVVTIRIADDTYNLDETVHIEHPDGARIHIVGNTLNPGEVRLVFRDVAGIVVDRGGALGLLDGVTLAFQGDVPARSGVVADEASFIGLVPDVIVEGFTGHCVGALKASSVIASSVTARRCSTGIHASEGADVDASQALLEDHRTAGVVASTGGTVNASGATIARSGHAFLAQFLGYIDGRGASVEGGGAISNVPVNALSTSGSYVFQ